MIKQMASSRETADERCCNNYRIAESRNENEPVYEILRRKIMASRLAVDIVEYLIAFGLEAL